MFGKKAIELGVLKLYPYGICMAVGIILCFAFLMYAFNKKNFNDEAIDKILFIGIFATAFGVFMAMVFQSVYNYIENPSAGFNLGEAMTFQGGLIGGVSSFLIVWNLYVFVIAPRTKVKFLQNDMNASLTDALPIIPIGITIAHAFGRLGCTFAGCCHGAQTDAWYGIWMYTEYGYAKVVPIQLFECLFLVALSAIMAVLFFKFKFKYNMGLYAIVYGVWRFAIEFARADDRGSFIGSISPSQFWSIIMVLLGIGYFFLFKYWLYRFEKHPELQPPVREPKRKKVAAGAAADGTTVEIAEVEAPNAAVADGGAENFENGATVETTDEPVEIPSERTQSPAESPSVNEASSDASGSPDQTADNQPDGETPKQDGEE